MIPKKVFRGVASINTTKADYMTASRVIGKITLESLERIETKIEVIDLIQQLMMVALDNEKKEMETTTFLRGLAKHDAFAWMDYDPSAEQSQQLDKH